MIGLCAAVYCCFQLSLCQGISLLRPPDQALCLWTPLDSAPDHSYRFVLRARHVPSAYPSLEKFLLGDHDDDRVNITHKIYLVYLLHNVSSTCTTRTHANVNFLRQRRTCTDQHLRPLNEFVISTTVETKPR